MFKNKFLKIFFFFKILSVGERLFVHTFFTKNIGFKPELILRFFWRINHFFFKQNVRKFIKISRNFLKIKSKYNRHVHLNLNKRLSDTQLNSLGIFSKNSLSFFFKKNKKFRFIHKKLVTSLLVFKKKEFFKNFWKYSSFTWKYKLYPCLRDIPQVYKSDGKFSSTLFQNKSVTFSKNRNIRYSLYLRNSKKKVFLKKSKKKAISLLSVPNKYLFLTLLRFLDFSKRKRSFIRRRNYFYKRFKYSLQNKNSTLKTFLKTCFIGGALAKGGSSIASSVVCNRLTTGLLFNLFNKKTYNWLFLV